MRSSAGESPRQPSAWEVSLAEDACDGGPSGLPDVSPAGVDRRHVLRNALLPISTIIGLQTGLLLSGAVLTETVFAWPGLGTWLVDAIANRNYPVLQGGILFIAIIFVMVNLIVDVSYAFINPRIRYS